MEGDFQRIPFPNLPNVKELLGISESLSAFVANYLKKKSKTFTINTNKKHESKCDETASSSFRANCH